MFKINLKEYFNFKTIWPLLYSTNIYNIHIVIKQILGVNETKP